MASVSARAGRYMKQRTGYAAFIPAPLPPDPPVDLDGPLHALLSRADQAIGRLDGVIQTVPNPDFFVSMYVRREAVLSSQIEGTQSTLEDLLAIELEPRPTWRHLPQDVEEVVRYVHAMNYGLARLSDLPLSLRLITEIHCELLTGDRGSHRLPGEFRRSQNWIGPENASLNEATFVPPPVHEMKQALHQGGANALNLYSTTAGELYLGWAYFPDITTKPGQAYLDGVVFDWETIPGGPLGHARPHLQQGL